MKGDDYVPNSCATTKLLLRRSIQGSVRHSAMAHNLSRAKQVALFEFAFDSKHITTRFEYLMNYIINRIKSKSSFAPTLKLWRKR